MNIGIDLDGVLFDTEAMIRAYSVIYNAKYCHKEELDSEELMAEYRYGWSKEEFADFVEKGLVYVHTTAPVMPYAKHCLEALNKNGHKLYVITSRGLLSEKEIEITNERLKQENLSFEKVVFNSKNKIEQCKELNLDLMIDDNIRHIKALSENGIKCLYFRDLVIKHFNNEKVKEVRNWGEICVELIKLGAIKAEDINI